MPEGFVTVTSDHTLKPVRGGAKDSVDKLPIGRVLSIKWSESRNYENHKRFFSFLRTTFDMQDSFESFEHFRRWLVMKAGYYTTAVAPNGSTMFFPDSINFDKMDEEQFKKLFSDCIDAFISGFDIIGRDELIRIVDYA